MKPLVLAVLATVALALAAAPGAGAVTVNGTIAITGTEGREDVRVDADFRPASAGKDESVWRIFPALVSSAPVVDGASVCRPITEPVTGRVVGQECDAGGGSNVTWSVDLKGGNDSLRMRLSEGRTGSVTADGGLGDDTLDVAVNAPRTLRGGDGNDVMTAPVVDTQRVIFDGGAGRDLVDYASGNTRGVNANLALGRASVSIPSPVLGGADQTRSDTLTAIERLSGTDRGDRLTGAGTADELLGGEGGDILDGGDANDTLNGGPGPDHLIGGLGSDVIDGGTGQDEFPRGSGLDTFISRDGELERLFCVRGDTMAIDLTDVVELREACTSVNTAAAKHRFDTRVPRTLRVVRGGVRGRLRCPARKPERCAGTLLLRLGNLKGGVISRARYRVRPGRRVRLTLRLSDAERRRVAGRTVTLDARETDADGRPRQVLRRLRVARAR